MTLCERFHCLPGELFQEDAEFLRMIRMVDAERERRGDGGGEL